MTQSLCAFGKLSPPVSEQVLVHVQERTYKRQQVLQFQDEKTEVLRVVKSGSVLMYRQAQGLDCRPVAIAPPGQLCGASVLVKVPNMLTITAMSDTRTCEIDIGAVEAQDMVEMPEFRRALAESIFRTVGTLADWSHVTRLPGVRAQLIAALKTLGNQQRSERVRLPGHAVLAELLGVTRESVVRSMSALEKEGAIVRVGRTYCELHLPAAKG